MIESAETGSYSRAEKEDVLKWGLESSSIIREDSRPTGEKSERLRKRG